MPNRPLPLQRAPSPASNQRVVCESIGKAFRKVTGEISPTSAAPSGAGTSPAAVDHSRAGAFIPQSAASSGGQAPSVSSSLTEGADYSDLCILRSQLLARAVRLSGRTGVKEIRADLQEVTHAMLAMEAGR